MRYRNPDNELKHYGLQSLESKKKARVRSFAKVELWRRREEAVGEQWFAVGGDDDRWWSETTAKGVGRPQTTTASRRQWRWWRRDWWEEAVDATVASWRQWRRRRRDRGRCGARSRSEAAVRGAARAAVREAAVDAAAVRAVEGDDDGDGFGARGETGSEEDEGRRCAAVSETALRDGGESVREKRQGVRGERRRRLCFVMF
ncbi:hypothetical protein Scep_017470 [Stephania cephalantha]|uniref:Uncharacterized protein n=1 Tax=Stephania cephalantha TaxID=152367 RepID=A0AAP0NTK4_9MAGN